MPSFFELVGHTRSDIFERAQCAANADNPESLAAVCGLNLSELPPNKAWVVNGSGAPGGLLHFCAATDSRAPTKVVRSTFF
jgi:hypothetical protein